MNEIRLEHLDDLALGSVFLATGGGGDPHIPTLIAREAIKTHGPVHLLSPDAVADDAKIITVGSVGAPTVSLELLPSLDDAPRAIQAFEARPSLCPSPVDALVSFEIGGGNSMMPLAAAAVLGRPVIDGDGMGRALPEAQMMSFSIAGISATPALAYDYAGNIATFEAKDTLTYERHIRSYSMAAGGMVTVVENLMSGRDLKHSVIPHTLSFAVKLGQTLRENRGQADGLLAPLKALFAHSIYGDCRMIYTGKVTNKTTRIIGGFDIGEATLSAFESGVDPLTISIKNEYLLAQSAGQVLASVPDLIVIVDYETGAPINAERLRFGQRVSVFAVGCPAFFKTEAALKEVHPRCFGFDIDYAPL